MATTGNLQCVDWTIYLFMYYMQLLTPKNLKAKKAVNIVSPDVASSLDRTRVSAVMQPSFWHLLPRHWEMIHPSLP